MFMIMYVCCTVGRVICFLFFLGIYFYFLVLAPGGFCGSWWLLVASAASVASMASMAPGL